MLIFIEKFYCGIKNDITKKAERIFTFTWLWSICQNKYFLKNKMHSNNGERDYLSDYAEKLRPAIYIFIELMDGIVKKYINKRELPGQVCNLLRESLADVVMLKYRN